MKRRSRGSCLCGAVAFEVDEFLGAAAHCHCSMCRKFHGAAYATFVSVARRAFHWISGQEELTDYQAPNGTVRSFCRRCGSSLFFASPRAPQDVVEVALAAFEADVPVVVDAHIFVGSRAAWTKMEGDLPQYEEGRASSRLA